jgi:ATP-dependent helicase/nuclease subunit A
MTMATNMTSCDATALADDAHARIRALELDSFIVQAPAGSGKTELLTQRFLKLLAHVEHPEEVVALTFTNKAASEMRNRILMSLEAAAAGERPGNDMPHKQITFDLSVEVLQQDKGRDKEHTWDLLQHPGRLKITTIDSLCNRLVSQMPYLSRFGASPQVTTNAKKHYQAAARETLALLEAQDDHAEPVSVALRYFDNDAGRLSALVAEMLEKRDQWYRQSELDWAQLHQKALAGLQHLLAQDLERAARAIGIDLQQQMIKPAQYASGKFEKTRALSLWNAPLAGQVTELPLWRALATLTLKDDGERRTSLDARQGFPAADPVAKPLSQALLAAIEQLSEEAITCLQHIWKLPDIGHSDEEWKIIEGLSNLLTLAEAHLLLEFQRAGVVDFIAIAQSAIDALGSEEAPTDLALALDYRIQHLLIDEFQDTSPKQVELIAGLTRGWHAQDNETRTLFLVGDPMQSIYRFRKAEVGLFLEVAAKGIGAIRPTHLQLVRNNRSEWEIVQWVNQIFPAVFPQTSDAYRGAVGYASCATDKLSSDATRVHVHPAVGKRGGDEAKKAEALSVIGIVDAAREQDPSASIGVLVRAKDHLAELIGTLRQLRPDLLYQAVEIETLDERQSVQDLLSLTQALLHRADRVNWLAVLRAPWCGLTLEDLHALAGEDHHSTIWQLMRDDTRSSRLSDDGRLRLLHVRQVMEQALQHQGRQSLRRWVEQTWQLLGGRHSLATEADVQDAESYFSLLEELVQAGTIDIDTLKERVQDLYAQPNPASAARQIQLMSVHKSKGLEFDCVILPGLHSPPRKGDSVLLRWEPVDVPGVGRCVIPAAIGKKASTASLPSIYDFLGDINTDRERYEMQRLLYVATTRARKSLHLLGTIQNKKKSGTNSENSESAYEAPVASSMLGLMWNGPVGEAFISKALNAPHKDAEEEKGLDNASFMPDLVRLNAESIRTLSVASESKQVEDPSASIEHEERDDGTNLYAAIGTLVHRCLEVVANDGTENWSPQRCIELKPAYQAWLCSRGYTGNAPEVGANLALQALVTTLSSEVGQWILQRRDDAHAERPLTSLAADGGTDVANHIVDRTFIENECRWIVDYKTVRCDAPDIFGYLNEHAEANYREQLERYASLFVHEGRQTKAAIFYVLQGVLVEISLDGMSTATLSSTA